LYFSPPAPQPAATFATAVSRPMPWCSSSWPWPSSAS